MAYIILIWHYERLVWISTVWIETAAVEIAKTALKKHVGGYATIYTAENGKLEEIRRIYEEQEHETEKK